MNSRHVDEGWRLQLGKALRFEGTVDLVGVGNPIRGDDAVGLEVVSRLRSAHGSSPRGIKIHPAEQMPERLLSKLASTSDRVIVFDAVEASLPPGAIVCRSLGDAKHGFFATHNVPLKLIPGLGPRLADFYVVGVQPESLEVTEGISDAAAEAVDGIADFFAEWLEEGR
ncbi:MAG: hydrogenase maturation protease [Nitrososphaerota archaeon]|nr:hydrogenase maturation protease [Nitrososphaerota archaeon]